MEKEFTIGIDDLLAKVTLEERLYRHRCVEAWSMTVPWSGFPMRDLVEPSPSRSLPQNMCAWRPSKIRRLRRASGNSGIPGPMSKG